jgi:hypothetical protein
MQATHCAALSADAVIDLYHRTWPAGSRQRVTAKKPCEGAACITLRIAFDQAQPCQWGWVNDELRTHACNLAA